jgi:hypothetical protein
MVVVTMVVVVVVVVVVVAPACVVLCWKRAQGSGVSEIEKETYISKRLQVMVGS